MFHCNFRRFLRSLRFVEKEFLLELCDNLPDLLIQRLSRLKAFYLFISLDQRTQEFVICFCACTEKQRVRFRVFLLFAHIFNIWFSWLLLVLACVIHKVVKRRAKAVFKSLLHSLVDQELYHFPSLTGVLTCNYVALS